MLPCVLVLATFAQPVPTPFGFWGQFAGLPTGGGMSVPLHLSVYVWGDPSFARSVQLPTIVDDATFKPLPRFNESKRPQPAPVPPLDPTAERIKAIETVILDLKTRGGSAAVIEQLQRDLDELKAKKM